MSRRFKIGDHVAWNSEAGREIRSDRTDHIAAHRGSALEPTRR